MDNWKIKQTIDLQEGERPVRVWPNAIMAPGDGKAHTWEITVLNGGAAANLTGASVTAYFNRNNRTKVLATGSVSGNVARVTFPAEAYAITGPMYGIFRVSASGGTVVTLSVIRFMILDGPYSETVDPGSAIPSIDDLLAEIGAMQTATAAANDAATAANTAASHSVRFDTAQSLTDAQKTQARTNIEAANESDFEALKQYVREMSPLSSTNAPYPYIEADNAAPLSVERLQGEIKPIQYLNGYGSAWMGGSGKNKYSGGNVELDTSTHSKTFAISMLPAGTYYFSCTKSGTASSGITLYFLASLQDQAVMATLTDNQVINGASFTLPYAASAVEIILTDQTKTLKLTDIQIESGSSKTSFAPYENICPIGGYTSAKLVRTGKNLLQNSRLESGSAGSLSWTRNANGSITISGTNDTGSTVSINLAAGTDHLVLQPGYYYLSAGVETNSNYQIRLYLVSIIDGNTQPQPSIGSNTEMPLEIKNLCWGVAYCRIAAGASVNTTFFPMLYFTPDTDEYVPYSGEYIDVPFTLNANTGDKIYGGTMNLLTGAGKMTKRCVTVSSSTTFTLGTSTGGIKYAKIDVTGIVSNDSGCLCSHYTRTSNATTDRAFRVISGAIYVYDNRFTSDSAAHEILDGVQFCYNLSTAVDFAVQVTPLVLARGYNAVMLDTGDISVDYRLSVPDILSGLIEYDEYDRLADASYQEGQFFFMGGQLYRATTAISFGESIIPGSNCEATNIADQLTAIWESINP